MKVKTIIICVLIVLLGVSLMGCAEDTQKSPANQTVTKISDSSDLIGKKIGVSLGSGADVQLTGNQDYELLRYDDATDALLGLNTNAVDAIAVEITTAREFIKKNDSLSVLGGDIGAERYGVAVEKGNIELKNKLDVFTNYLKDSGAYSNMVARWIKSGADSIKMPDIKQGNGDVLKVGINAEYAPFEYMGENNEFLGFDIEYIKRFAAFYGLRLEFYYAEFSSLFIALDEGAVDLVISAVAMTEERLQRYDFSDAYYENEIVFVTNAPIEQKNITSVNELEGRSIGLLSEIAKEHTSEKISDLKNSQILYFEDMESELMALRAKRISAFLAVEEDAKSLAQNNEDLAVLSAPVTIDENIYHVIVSQEVEQQPLKFIEKIKTSFYDNLIKEQRYMLVLNGLWITIQISLASAVIGTVLGMLFCLFKLSEYKLLKRFAAGYVKIIQGTPIVVLLLIVCYIIFAKASISQLLIAIITFGVYFSAYVCELLMSSLGSVGKGQTEAALALGYTNTHAFLRHILPQAIINALPLYRAEFISLVKTTSVVGYIAISDLTKASDIITSRTYEAFFPLIMVAIIYFILAYLMTLGLKFLENKLDTSKRKRRIKL